MVDEKYKHSVLEPILFRDKERLPIRLSIYPLLYQEMIGKPSHYTTSC